ncbi:hypothetical protein Q3G72_012169 [Acer saccharum]|nr:hypothetical protein Q3G72_012169 [Acer saccharum]
MDTLQVVSSATQIISSMIGAVGALELAYRNLDEAPKRIRSLEDFVCDLENLTRCVKQKHVYKLHNSQLDHQLQSLKTLTERLHPKIGKARRIMSRSKIKNLAQVVWTSMTRDPLGKLVHSIKDDLNWWLESQILTQNVERVIEITAQEIPTRLKVKSEQGYPISSKCLFLRNLLEQESSQHVILIVGLSGIGKSCLARQVASDRPARFVGEAVELGFGQWCSRAACNGSKVEYKKRLSRKISKFLVQIGFWKKINNDNSGDLEYLCCMLQEALYGKSTLILLDNVWEQDIVERFAKLYDNDCKYLVTTRNESVYEITEAEKVELSKDEIKEISKAILLYRCRLSGEEIPFMAYGNAQSATVNDKNLVAEGSIPDVSYIGKVDMFHLCDYDDTSDVADCLLERCGHPPLTVAVMGKALRKELRAEKWEKAMTNISTYATCAEGPSSYVNEKEAENTLTIVGSFEFSLEAMPEDSRQLFIALAALSWAEPVPEACVEATSSVLGQKSLFPLIVCKLVEGSLLMKADTDPLYEVHNMVSLYLDSKINDSAEILLNESKAEETASICPWLLIFGKEKIKEVAKRKIELSFSVLDEKQVIISLEAILEALMASKSISELETSRASFSSILGPRIADLISTD